MKCTIVKLPNFKLLPNQIKYEFARRNALELFDYFCYFFCKKFVSIRSNHPKISNAVRCDELELVRLSMVWFDSIRNPLNVR